MTDADDDSKLLARIRENDPGAFEDFVERYGDRIFGFGLRVCGEPENAREVAQETLLQAFRSLRDLKDPGALRTWLYRVAANACRMKHRKGKYEPRRLLSLEELMPGDRDEATFEIPDVSALPDEAAERAELRAAVRAAVEELPCAYRVVLALRDMEQLSTREVAQATGLTETAVKMRVHRGRLMVRKRLAAVLRGEREDKVSG